MTDSNARLADEVVDRKKGLSVIVVTYRGHARFAEELLTSLEVATRGLSEPYEFILVDDEPPFDSSVVRQACIGHGATYLVGPQSVPLKVNVGISHAHYDVVLLIGADCLATPKLLVEHLAVLRSSGGDVGGVVGPTQYMGQPERHWAIADFYGYNAAYKWAFKYKELRWAPTNFSIRVSVLKEVGGYPEEGRTLVGGDDVIFGLRVSDSGFRWVTNPKALLIHRFEGLTLTAMLKRLVTYGRADSYLCSVVPRHRKLHVNPLLAGLIGCFVGFIAGTRLSVRLGAALTVGITLLCLASLGEVRHQIRKLRKQTCRASFRDGFYLVAGSLLMSLSFDLGALIGSIQSGRPWLTLFQFNYEPNSAIRKAESCSL